MRGRVAGLLLLAGLAPSMAPARAEFINAPDVVVYCDPTLAPALLAVGQAYRARTGVPVRVLSAPGPQLLALIARGTRDDVLATQVNWLDDAAARRLVDPETRGAVWRDPVVVAGRGTAPIATAADPATLAQRLEAALAGGRLGVIDPTLPGGPDGPALVARLGWHATLAGEIDGPGVAFLIARGAVPLGVLPRSAAVARPGIGVIATLPGDAAPADAYAAAVSKNVLSRNTAAFMAFLATAPARDALRGAGLEVGG